METGVTRPRDREPAGSPATTIRVSNGGIRLAKVLFTISASVFMKDTDSQVSFLIMLLSGLGSE